MTAPVLSRVEGGVATLTLNRPHARNAITVGLAQTLHDGLLDAAERARVVVVRGAGGTFCAGGDFDEVARLRAQGPEAMRPLFETFIGACELIGELPVPVVAAVEGYAERFESTVDDVVANLLGKDPTALARIKHLVRAGLRVPLTDGLAMETDEIIAHLGEEDTT